MKHVIIGTAGHIDHGKTTLIKAITGRETDRLKEEKDRGISIELGFTYFDLPSGLRAGIIDVPGHEKFIKNMLAGVVGIDIVLLVVAADEGIMPQTTEHLHILDLLGIKKGIVVVTKKDMADEEWTDMVEEDIMTAVEGTFLENSPMIRVSSHTKEGIGDLIALIDKYASELEERNTADMPRLPVDRVFSISGFGTVVTGTLLSGRYKVGDEVQIYPGEDTARIRTLQVHDQDAEVAYGGQRVAINLSGVKKDQIPRGSVIAPVNSMKDSMMIDAKVKLLKSMDRNIENRTRLKLYIGSQEVLCRIVLLDREELKPGEEAYVQLRLEEKIVSKRGDRFILRFYSPMFTIGGGTVLETNPDKKKRFDPKVIEELKIKESGSSEDIIEKMIQKKGSSFLSVKELSREGAMLEENINQDINTLKESGKILLYTVTKDSYPIHIDYFNLIKENIVDLVNDYHKKYPLRLGISKEEIRSKILGKAKPKVADMIIQDILDLDVLYQKDDLLGIKGFEPSYTDSQKRIMNLLMDKLKNEEYLPPRKEDIAAELSLDKEDIDEVLNYLYTSKEIVKINEEVFLLTESYNKAIEELRVFLKDSGEIAIGDYRDLLKTNRKVAIGLLEHFDGLKITKRVGEKRSLY